MREEAGYRTTPHQTASGFEGTLTDNTQQMAVETPDQQQAGRVAAPGCSEGDCSAHSSGSPWPPPCVCSVQMVHGADAHATAHGTTTPHTPHHTTPPGYHRH